MCNIDDLASFRTICRTQKVTRRRFSGVARCINNGRAAARAHARIFWHLAAAHQAVPRLSHKAADHTAFPATRAEHACHVAPSPCLSVTFKSVDRFHRQRSVQLQTRNRGFNRTETSACVPAYPARFLHAPAWQNARKPEAACGKPPAGRSRNHIDAEAASPAASACGPRRGAASRRR